MIGSYLRVFQNYANFSGRARRSEYWWFTLVHAVLIVWLQVLIALATASEARSQTPSHLESATLLVVYVAYLLASIVPALAVHVRRLHDTGRSGWWLAIVLVPVIGVIVLAIFHVMDGSPGENAYGPSPKHDDVLARLGERSY